MLSVLSQDSDLLDWRLFLLSVALPWPMPTKQQLLQVLGQFRAADPQDTGFITEKQYLQVPLHHPSWITTVLHNETSMVQWGISAPLHGLFVRCLRPF